MQTSRSRTLLVGAALALVVAGCGDSSKDEPVADASDPAETVVDQAGPDVTDPVATPATDVPPADPGAAPVTELGPGPISVIALGDSLTAGEGDDSGVGFVGYLTQSIAATPGRADSYVSNYGASGWTSQMMVDGEGEGGAPGELGAAVEQVKADVAEGKAVLATVLIGSNDMWYLYQYSPPESPTTPKDLEDAAAEMFRTNLDRTVSELGAAGAVVVLGLPDDQSLRPVGVDIEWLQTYLSDVTAEEVQQMSAMSVRLGEIVKEVAAEHDLRTVDTNGPFWSDASKMAADKIHPNGDGYADLAALWFAVIQDML